jgi:hypothetical protein
MKPELRPDLPASKGDVFCEVCGVLIYRQDPDGKTGHKVDDRAGICPDCKMELCGKCAEWAEDGLCITCHDFPFSHCHYCGASFTIELRGEYGISHCPWCGHEIDRENIEDDPVRKIS